MHISAPLPPSLRRPRLSSTFCQRSCALPLLPRWIDHSTQVFPDFTPFPRNTRATIHAPLHQFTLFVPVWLARAGEGRERRDGMRREGKSGGSSAWRGEEVGLEREGREQGESGEMGGARRRTAEKLGREPSRRRRFEADGGDDEEQKQRRGAQYRLLSSRASPTLLQVETSRPESIIEPQPFAERFFLGFPLFRLDSAPHHTSSYLSCTVSSPRPPPFDFISPICEVLSREQRKLPFDPNVTSIVERSVSWVDVLGALRNRIVRERAEDSRMGRRGRENCAEALAREEMEGLGSEGRLCRC